MDDEEVAARIAEIRANVVVSPDDVARVKAELIRKSAVAAHANAVRLSKQGHSYLDALYSKVAEELAADGYAPDSCGQPGPAVKAHYESSVLGG